MEWRRMVDIDSSARTVKGEKEIRIRGSVSSLAFPWTLRERRRGQYQHHTQHDVGGVIRLKPPQ